ncbi:MAG TPA: hypothetical protein VD794_12425, partial [Flavisolibacter sp.]|nr:hypothetical protein [Flavisolibacter sp.]
LIYATQKPETSIAKQMQVKPEKTITRSSNTVHITSTATSNNDAETIIPLKEESLNVPTSSSKDQSGTITKRYTVVAKEDGQIVRLSQKAYAVFDCAVKGVAQKSENCKENIETMQAKMATSMISPTTDFAGLIDMIKTLEENK